ncbi:hypothetical protein ACFPAF_16585 [Hymenobacter endophyticus]|uniref:Uncharacterized protein n=1 Tax=Hymenobacter endophyticus TaxID=3076335 RepID=A0ABU3TKW3_9BACT|nr:hypothetical protein [Hymenobacter endophyticus]MDU0372022.1 hypothetical protein [Hymenobacter endophyticus]
MLLPTTLPAFSVTVHGVSFCVLLAGGSRPVHLRPKGRTAARQAVRRERAAQPLRAELGRWQDEHQQLEHVSHVEFHRWQNWRRHQARQVRRVRALLWQLSTARLDQLAARWHQVRGVWSIDELVTWIAAGAAQPILAA